MLLLLTVRGGNNNKQPKIYYKILVFSKDMNWRKL